jgi:hypothetical protein
MRHPIETAPRNRKVVVLEDEKTATVDVASWSAEPHAWLGENGELCKIAPTHWHALRRERESDGHSASKAAAVDILKDKIRPRQAQRAKPGWRRFAVCSMAAILAASLIGMYFRADAGYVTRHANLRHGRKPIGTSGRSGDERPLGRGQVAGARQRAARPGKYWRGAGSA